MPQSSADKILSAIFQNRILIAHNQFDAEVEEPSFDGTFKTHFVKGGGYEY